MENFIFCAGIFRARGIFTAIHLGCRLLRKQLATIIIFANYNYFRYIGPSTL